MGKLDYRTLRENVADEIRMKILNGDMKPGDKIIEQELASEAMKCQTDEEAESLGIEWCIHQCRELIACGVPSIHFYTVSAVNSVKEVAKAIY